MRTLKLTDASGSLGRRLAGCLALVLLLATMPTKAASAATASAPPPAFGLSTYDGKYGVSFVTPIEAYNKPTRFEFYVYRDKAWIFADSAVIHTCLEMPRHQNCVLLLGESLKSYLSANKQLPVAVRAINGKGSSPLSNAVGGRRGTYSDYLLPFEASRADLQRILLGYVAVPPKTPLMSGRGALSAGACASAEIAASWLKLKPGLGSSVKLAVDLFKIRNAAGATRWTSRLVNLKVSDFLVSELYQKAGFFACDEVNTFMHFYYTAYKNALMTGSASVGLEFQSESTSRTLANLFGALPASACKIVLSVTDRSSGQTKRFPFDRTMDYNQRSCRTGQVDFMSAFIDDIPPSTSPPPSNVDMTITGRGNQFSPEFNLPAGIFDVGVQSEDGCAYLVSLKRSPFGILIWQNFLLKTSYRSSAVATTRITLDPEDQGPGPTYPYVVAPLASSDSCAWTVTIRTVG